MRRPIVLIVAALTCFSAITPGIASAAGKFQLEESTIADIHDAIKSGEITCKSLVQAYMDRAKSYNGACTRLVTEKGGPIPAAKGAVRAGAPISFPTKTLPASSLMPNLDQYSGLPLDLGRMEATA